ncbi:MAG: cytidine deaminase [bacterium]
MDERTRDNLVIQAQAAQSKAVAPYSNFQVGAAILTKSGVTYSGCNIEVSSYGLTICAERVAIFKAISEGEREFDALAVIAKTAEFCPPCGACRQVLMDYAPDLKIILLNSEGKSKETTIADLFPEAFTGDFLV